MRVNVGSADRLIRIGLGLVLILLPFVSGLPLFTSLVATAASVVIGAVLIVTALVRFCPLYTLFGLSTCKVSSR